MQAVRVNLRIYIRKVYGGALGVAEITEFNKQTNNIIFIFKFTTEVCHENSNDEFITDVRSDEKMFKKAFYFHIVYIIFCEFILKLDFSKKERSRFKILNFSSSKLFLFPGRSSQRGNLFSA